jgi:hypothetical protein
MRIRKWHLAVAGCLLILVLSGLNLPTGSNIPIGKKNYAYVKPASLIRSMRQEAFCTILCQPKGASPGKIVLWQDFCDGPVMLLPSTNANILLCFYDFDVDMRLFRVDTSQPFTALPTASSINRILFFSDWRIQYGTASDWQELQEYLSTASKRDVSRQLVHSGRFLINSQNSMLESLKYKNMYPD